MAHKKERKCPWLGRRQIENCQGKTKLDERSEKSNYKESGIKKLRRNIGNQQGKI